MINQLDTYYLGSLLYVGIGGPPSGWDRCDGQQRLVRDNPGLAAIMGVGNQRDFALPDLMQDPTTPRGLLPIINMSGEFPYRPSDDALSTVSKVPGLTGQILYVATKYAPDGWAICDGSLLSVNKYGRLFNLLGTRFGGDGQTHFGLPNLVGAPTTPQGFLPVICVNGTDPEPGPKWSAGWQQIDAYYCQVIYLAFDSPVTGWGRCDGRLLSVKDNVVLSRLLGNRFGGDGQDSVALPDLLTAPTTPPGLIPVMALNGRYPT